LGITICYDIITPVNCSSNYRKISPRVDRCHIKKILGVEENKDLFISLINSLVGNENQVYDITLLTPIILKTLRKINYQY